MTLYLKYRPQDFTTLVGQDFINISLKSAIKNQKTVGAYLFTGPRGTGKTSTARIFAKAVNCLHNEDGNPCGSCDICRDFQQEKLIDIVEIDAASHTGVDNIREIISTAEYSPSICKYKIYIIDEVHMLSKGAFNALLKILEEPPSHVKFILATTDVYKVPETILSRCQRYDFRSIGDEVMRTRLQYIAQNEGIQVDSESLDYIIDCAKGGLRNALTLFEQLIFENTLSIDFIRSRLGVSSTQQKENFMEKLIKKDTSVLHDFSQLMEEGKDSQIFIKELVILFQQKTEKRLLDNQDIRHDIQILDILQKLLGELKYSFDPRIVIKTTLMQILTLSGSSQEHSSSHKEKEYKNLEAASPKITQKISTGEKQVQKEVKTNLDIETITDIFSPSENLSPQDALGKEVLSLKDDLLDAMKKKGLKSAFIMTIKGSQLFVGNGICTIKTKNNFTANSINTQDAKTHIQEILKNLDPQIHSLHIC